AEENRKEQRARRPDGAHHHGPFRSQRAGHFHHPLGARQPVDRHRRPSLPADGKRPATRGRPPSTQGAFGETQMIRIVATTTLCALFLAAGFFTSNAVPGRQATIEDVATLRQMQPRSLSVWLQYLELQESGIEFAMQRRPEEFAKAL